MTDKLLYCEDLQKNPPKRKRRRIRLFRVLFMAAILLLLFFAMISLVYRLVDERDTVSPLVLPQGAETPVTSESLPDPLIELLEKNPETYDFVMGYAAARVPLSEIDISGDVTEGEIPLFLQWDERWGYDEYGSGMIAITGCGPTCLSMVAVGLLGDMSLNPRAVADFSAENGYYAWGSGTAWTLMTEGAGELGLFSRELPLSEQAILSELKSGSPVICSVGSGDFTTDGHYIVLTGVNSDGTVEVNDPNSLIRSGADWDIGVLVGQIKNLWAFSADGQDAKTHERRPPL